jgi:hypothetical protein
VRRALLIAAVVFSTIGVVMGALWAGLEGGDRLWPVTWVVWAPVGALILWKRPGNGVGFAMLGIGVSWGIGFLCLVFAFSTVASLQVRVWAELMNVLFGVFPWLGIIWMLLIFPSGRLEGRLERYTAIALAALCAIAVFSFLVTLEPMEATGLPSPLAIDWLSDVTGWFVTAGFVLVLMVTLVAVVSMTRRWRRSSGVERHQYRWLLLGAAIFLIILSMGNVLPEGNEAMYLWVVGGMAIPGAVGIAVTRYRLFEIDRLLSRTVTYTVVVAVLASLFALVAIGIPNWMPGMSESPLLVAAATLGVAALFNPLRRRVQKGVDRRFNRSRYNAEKVMAAFAGTLQEELEVAGIAGGWAQVVTETMEPASVGIWVRS